MNSEAPIVVSVRNVYKEFSLNRDSSLKERLVSMKSGVRTKKRFTALQDVTLNIRAGTTIGLIGHNGSGKSTLLKVIGGILDPTSGRVERRGRVAALLELGAGFHPDLTGRENVYLNASLLGLSRAQTDAVFEQIVDFAEIPDFIDTQVKFYSSGMYVRLAFAVAVHTDPDILLVDEVLAVGDEVFQRKCMAKINAFQKEGRTIILVSHSADQVRDLCDRVLLMHHGVPVFEGDPEEGIRQLRVGYERDRLTSLETGDRHAPRPRIESIQVQTDAPEENAQVVRGEAFTIIFEYSVPDPDTAPLVIGVGIDTHLGQTLFGVSSQDFSGALPNHPGRHRYEFTMEYNPLSLGSYSLRGVLEYDDGTLLDHATPASFFDVITHEEEEAPPEVMFTGRVMR